VRRPVPTAAARTGRFLNSPTRRTTLASLGAPRRGRHAFLDSQAAEAGSRNAPLVTEGIEPAAAVLCDIAAGAGHYTFAYAPQFRFVLHCDLSVENLNYERRKAREQDLENIFFLRVYYFQPPFRHSLDRMLCLDTLIRGEAHDAMLLKSIADSLQPVFPFVQEFNPGSRLDRICSKMVPSTPIVYSVRGCPAVPAESARFSCKQRR
jgi:hypothetical protein